MKQAICKKYYDMVVCFLFLFFLIPSAAIAEKDLTDQVELKQTKLVYLKNAQTSFILVGVKNISDNVLVAPIKVVIDSISTPDVTVANPDGYTTDGKPYFSYSSDTTMLTSENSTSMKQWRFSNIRNLEFTYTCSVYGRIIQNTIERRSVIVDAGSGGTIKINDEESLYSSGLEIIIPPGALSQDTKITISDVIASIPAANDGFVYIGLPVGLEPHEITFLKPITIKFHYTIDELIHAGISDPSHIKVAFYNDTTKQWEEVPVLEIDQMNQLITIETTHFSWWNPFSWFENRSSIENPATPEKILDYVENTWKVYSTLDDLNQALYNESLGLIPYSTQIGYGLKFASIYQSIKSENYYEATEKAGMFIAKETAKQLGYATTAYMIGLADLSYNLLHLYVHYLDKQAFNAQISYYIYWRNDGMSQSEILSERTDGDGWVMTPKPVIGGIAPKHTGRFKQEHVFLFGEAIYQASLASESLPDEDEALRDSFILALNEYSNSKNPVASFSVSPSSKLNAPGTVSLNPSGSYAIDGAYIVEYQWDFGNGMKKTTLNADTVSVTYNRNGDYTVRLVVKDNNNKTAAMEHLIVITAENLDNVAPIVDFNYTVNTANNLNINFDASSSYDPDGSIIDFEWSFGDGYYAKGPIVSHSFETVGSYNISLKATDNDLKAEIESKVIDVYEVGTSSKCGAYVAPDVWKEFDCYNLAAIGKVTGADPFSPSWELNGGYWQWGRKGPDPSVWYDTNTPNFAHGPTGPDANEANSGEISGWDQTLASDGAWSDSIKTANDPCPAGFRVPTQTQWRGVVDNNTQSTMGTWSSIGGDYTNYTAALSFGDDLMLPAAGIHNNSSSGALFNRGHFGYYWSSSVNDRFNALFLFFHNLEAETYHYVSRLNGFSVRCIEDFMTKPGYSGITQNYNDESYFIAFAITGDSINSIDVLDGPNIISTWDNHASLSDRPEPGDTYTIRINYSDGASEETSYTVEGINDHPALIVWPENFEIIDTTDPTFEWQQVTGISSSYSIIIHKIEGDEETLVWKSGDIAPEDTSCVFNFDNSASESLQPGGTYHLYLHSYDENGNQATSTIIFIISENGNYTGTCGAYVAPGVWKEFDCYNLAAIGKTTNDDPFTPSWRLIGGYWQWGRKGPDPSVWYDTNTPNFAHGPTGPNANEANSGEISGWDQTYASDGAWSDSIKTANDPCPAGYRVPTRSQWEGVLDNNTQSTVGSWSTNYYDHTNYSSACLFGNAMMLPTAGYHSGESGALSNRGRNGGYSSSSYYSSNSLAWNLDVGNGYTSITYNSRRTGFSVRCVAEDQYQNFDIAETRWIIQTDQYCQENYSGGEQWFFYANGRVEISGTPFLGYWVLEDDQITVTRINSSSTQRYTGVINYNTLEIEGTYTSSTGTRCWKAYFWVDSDGDGIPDLFDDCPNHFNSGIDVDFDGVDDVCDPFIVDLSGTTWKREASTGCSGVYNNTTYWHFLDNGQVADLNGKIIGRWGTDGDQVIVVTGTDWMNRVRYTGTINSSLDEMVGTYDGYNPGCFRAYKN